MVQEFLKNLWRWKVGLEEIDTNPIPINFKELKKSEWSDEFEKLMRNRLVMGAIRYGKIHSKGKAKYDRIEAIINRLDTYIDTGNDELLVDIANLCLLEFEEGEHPKKHFKAVDDSNEHVKTK